MVEILLIYGAFSICKCAYTNLAESLQKNSIETQKAIRAAIGVTANTGSILAPVFLNTTIATCSTNVKIFIIILGLVQAGFENFQIVNSIYNPSTQH